MIKKNSNSASSGRLSNFLRGSFSGKTRSASPFSPTLFLSFSLPYFILSDYKIYMKIIWNFSSFSFLFVKIVSNVVSLTISMKTAFFGNIFPQMASKRSSFKILFIIVRKTLELPRFYIYMWLKNSNSASSGRLSYFLRFIYISALKSRSTWGTLLKTMHMLQLFILAHV